MALISTLDVMMLCPGELVAPGIGLAAARNDWPVLKEQPYRQMLREIASRKPRLVLVQISPPLHEAIDLMELIKQHWPHLPIVAGAVAHHEQIEQAARVAGATLYLPDVSEPEITEQAIGSLLGSSWNNPVIPERRSRVAG